MKTIFGHIYQYFAKHRAALFIWFAASFLLVGYFASRVNFEEDISKILPKDKTSEKLTEVFQGSKFLDKLVVTVSLTDTTKEADPDALVAYADTFVAAIQKDLAPYIAKINYKTDDDLALQMFDNISAHLPVYLQENDYAKIDSLISPAGLKATLEQDYRTLTSPAGIALKGMISNDPVGISFIALKKLQDLQYDENFELYDNYIVTKDHKHLMMFITPAYPPNNTGKNKLLLDGLDRVKDSLHTTEYKNAEAVYFGAVAVSVGNALQLRKDSLLTQGFTVVFIILFIGLYFRKKRAPVVILIPVVFGALFSLACIYFLKGSISVIALGTGSIVLGIAVNYSLHVFNHYRHTRSIEAVISDLSQPLTIGSFTTIGGFLCLEFAKSEMLKDLGLFAACSLLGASICSLVFLPHFIASKKEQATHHAEKLSWIDKLAGFRPEFNKYIVLVIVALTILFSFYAGKAGFEPDMLRMNYMNDGLKKAEKQLNQINQYALQSVYLVAEGKNLDDALRKNEQLMQQVEQLKQKGSVTKYSGVSSLLISDSLQKQRIQTWNNYWTAEKKQQLFALLEKEGAAIGFSAAAFDKFKALLNTSFEPADTAAVAGLRHAFLDDYINEKSGKASVVTLLKVPAGAKNTIYKNFSSLPQVTVVDKQYLTTKFVENINTDFSRIALMSSILVFAVLLLTYGRIELALVSFIPMFITWVWILGIMGMLGIQFNIINIIISALIFGLGDDYSLFIMDGLLGEYKTGRKNLSSYKSSIFLSAITTIAGLGVLIFAKHPALRSIALISIIGIVCVVVISQVLIPFLFNIIVRNRVRKGHFPWTLTGFSKSIFSLTYFAVGSIIMTIVGWLLKLIPFQKEKVKHFYHFLISKYCWTVMYIMGNISKRIVNPLKEDHQKPAVIICNHQSFLDILCTVMLYPKMILFTNNWVWNSPVFGAVVRMADYYPVERGAEHSLELLAGRVKQGYSIVIFPEGTRSPDSVMKRFHKGAFYVAEQLNLDILPIMIHGTGYTMTKSDFLLKDGHVTLEYLPRIKPDDANYGVGYAERTKKISRYFKSEYDKLKTRIEQPKYYKEQLYYNYLYKGPVLEWYMRIKIRLEKYYQPFHEMLPMHGDILDIGCGYGFMPYMLQFAAPGRNITALDYDEEKIATANNCFSKNDRINFVYADAAHYKFTQNYDAIVLADMLHYLDPATQKHLIENCIAHIKPGGKIIIREGNAELQHRHRGTKLTEFFSTKMFGFNKTGSNGLSYITGAEVTAIAASKGMAVEIKDETRYTSNVIFIIKHPPGANG